MPLADAILGVSAGLKLRVVRRVVMGEFAARHDGGVSDNFGRTMICVIGATVRCGGCRNFSVLIKCTGWRLGYTDPHVLNKSSSCRLVHWTACEILLGRRTSPMVCVSLSWEERNHIRPLGESSILSTFSFIFLVCLTSQVPRSWCISNRCSAKDRSTRLGVMLTWVFRRSPSRNPGRRDRRLQASCPSLSRFAETLYPILPLPLLNV